MRPRKHEGLPVNLYLKGTKYIYRRPDTKKTFTVGGDLAESNRIALQANEMLGIDSLMRVTPDTCLVSVQKWVGRNGPPQCGIILGIFSDILRTDRPEPVKDNARIITWADQEIEGRKYKGRQFVRTSGMTKETLPDWARSMLKKSRGGAIARNIEFSLTEDDLLRLISECAGRCSVTGVRLRQDAFLAKRTTRPWAPSIDRIDSNKGYYLDNCRIVCVAANMAMNQWGEEVLLEMARCIVKKRAA